MFFYFKITYIPILLQFINAKKVQAIWGLNFLNMYLLINLLLFHFFNSDQASEV